MRRSVLSSHGVVLAVSLLLSTGAGAQTSPDLGLLPQAPGSDARGVPIEALKARAATLAAGFAPHVHANTRAERMPYRLFTPGTLEPGRRYPLVVFLHGAGGSGTDNGKQLEGANVFGALVWTLPQGLELIKNVGADNFGLLLDTFHMNIEEAVIETAFVNEGNTYFTFMLPIRTAGNRVQDILISNQSWVNYSLPGIEAGSPASSSPSLMQRLPSRRTVCAG